MRQIVFIGNCQIVWSHDVYRRFIALSRDETVTCIPGNDALSAEARAALASVGLIVEPQLSFTPDLDFGDIPLQGIRHPMLAAGLAAFHAGQGAAAPADVTEGLRGSPRSAAGHAAVAPFVAGGW
jgi:hypothetical protein